MNTTGLITTEMYDKATVNGYRAEYTGEVIDSLNTQIQDRVDELVKALEEIAGLHPENPPPSAMTATAALNNYRGE